MRVVVSAAQNASSEKDSKSRREVELIPYNAEKLLWRA